MQSRSEWHTSESAKVEVGIFAHEGREFSALGAAVSDTHAAGYPSFPMIEMGHGAANMRAEHKGARGDLNDWSGNKLGTCRIVAQWPCRSHWHGTMYQIEATIDGRTYTGRGQGHGMLWRGKVKREVKS